jgi:hypothetical protein
VTRALLDIDVLLALLDTRAPSRPPRRSTCSAGRVLAPATAHGGRFATFDSSLPLSAVRGASEDHLTVL